MKKTLTILAIVVVALVAMMSSVNAATVNVQPNNVQKVNEGETVKVTVKVAPCNGFSCYLKYDPAVFQFESADCAVNSKTAGTVRIAVLDITATNKAETATITFKALKTIDATQSFSVTDIDRDGTPDANTTGELTIVKVEPSTEPSPAPGGETTTPTEPSNPTNSETKTETTTTSAENQKVGTDGKVINKLPQTGAPVYIIAITLVTLAGAALVIKKVRK